LFLFYYFSSVCRVKFLSLNKYHLALNTKTDEVIYTNAFYYLGHFSKFIRPGAKRIACSTSRSNIQATAFKNKDGKICVVILNQSENSQQLILQLNGESVQLQVAAHAIYSVII